MNEIKEQSKIRCDKIDGRLLLKLFLCLYPNWPNLTLIVSMLNELKEILFSLKMFYDKNTFKVTV